MSKLAKNALKTTFKKKNPPSIFSFFNKIPFQICAAARRHRVTRRSMKKPASSAIAAI